MKGFMFFVNLHSIVKIARVCLIPAILFMFIARGITLMVVSGLVLITCFLLSIIRAPSDEVVIKEINSFHEVFKKRISAEIELNNYKDVEILKGYRHQGRMFLKRRVRDQYVYPCIKDIAFASNGSEYYIYTNESHLMARKENTVKKFRITKGNVRFSTSPLKGDNTFLLEVIIVDQNECISIIVDNDYHLRNFETFISKIN